MIDLLLQNLRRTISEIQPDELYQSLQQNESVKVIDIRDSEERALGFISGSEALSRSFLELRIQQVAADPQQPLVVLCASGTRSLFAAKALIDLGYQNVRSLRGGIKEWKDRGFAIETPPVTSNSATSRYQAQTRLPEVGEAGQAKLSKAKVLVVGAGGLGSPVCLYLAAAGVGEIGVMDDDVVDTSNLQRQVLHSSERVGIPKVESAFLTMKNLNPQIRVHAIRERLTVDNVDRILPDYDLIIDGCDNFQTRYLVNDACLKHGKLNVHGAIFKFSGQCSVFCHPQGPCYRCLYEEPPPADLAPSCNEAGVLGVLPGTIGLFQSTEALKLILGLGQAMVGQLLVYDALTMDLQKFKVGRNPECPTCSKDRTQIQYQNYQEFCSR